MLHYMTERQRLYMYIYIIIKENEGKKANAIIKRRSIKSSRLFLKSVSHLSLSLFLSISLQCD